MKPLYILALYRKRILDRERQKKQQNIYVFSVRFEVFTMVNIQFEVFWIVTLCSAVI